MMYGLKYKLPGKGEGKGESTEDASIYIAGLPDDTTDLDLYKIFSSFGRIHTNGVKAMLSDDGKTCKGIGFVNYIDAESARAAVSTLDGSLLTDGSYLKVNIKKPKPSSD